MSEPFRVGQRVRFVHDNRPPPPISIVPSDTNRFYSAIMEVITPMKLNGTTEVAWVDSMGRRRIAGWYPYRLQPAEIPPLPGKFKEWARGHR